MEGKAAARCAVGCSERVAGDVQNRLEGSRSVWRAVPLAPGEDVAIVERQRPPGIRRGPRLLPGVEVPPLMLEPDRAGEMAGLAADGDGALALRNRTGVIVGQR